MKIFVISFFTILLITGCGSNNIDSTQPKINPEEKAFNNSGRAKAILNESDLLPIKETSLEKLQGIWISTDDSDSIIEIKNDSKLDFYAGELMFKNSFVITEEIYLTVGQENPLKYKIKNITENNLELIYLDRGNILKYIKK